MAINIPGTAHRTMGDQLADMEQVQQNILDESWKDWPNEAGVSPTQITNNLKS